MNGELGTRRDKRKKEENAMAEEGMDMMSVEEAMIYIQLVETPRRMTVRLEIILVLRSREG